MTELVVSLLDILARVGDMILKAIEPLPSNDALRAEAMARLAVIQRKLAGHDAYARGLQDELDEAVPPK